MREMKDSGVEWIGEIPREWEVVQIKSIVSCKNEKSSYVGGAYIGLEHIESGSGKLLTDGSQTGIEVDSTVSSFDDTNILFGKLRPYLAKVAKPNFSGQCSGEILVLSPSSRIQKDFLFWCLLNPSFVDAVNAATYGAKMPRANWNFIGSSYLPLPSLNRQIAISGSLNIKCAQIDALITNVQTQIEKLKEYKQSLITEAVTKGLDPNVAMKDSGVEWIGEIPEYYYSIQLKRLAEIVRGGSPRPAGDDRYYDGDIPFMKISDITKDDGIYVDSCVHTIKPAGLSSTRKIDAGTLLLTNSGATLGVPKINTFSTTFNDGIAAFLNISESIDILFAYYSLKSRTKLFLEEASMGMGQPNLNTDIIGNTYIVLPPREEQQRIVEFLNAKCSQIDQVISIKQSKIEKLEQYKKSLIYEYVTGKKEVL